MGVRTVPDRLRAAAQLFEERNAAYGGNYTRFGPVMAAMFPGGLHLHGPEQLGRLVLFCHQLTKLTRYAMNMDRGGHADSLEDEAVYAMMNAELDDTARELRNSITAALTNIQVSGVPDASITEERDALARRLKNRARGLRGAATKKARAAGLVKQAATKKHRRPKKDTLAGAR